MAIATPQQAREHHAQQAAIAAGAAVTVRRQLAAGAGWAELLTTVATAQLRAALLAVNTMAARADAQPVVNPVSFAGVSALGYPISEPMVATIDAKIKAPVEALPAPWWDEAEFALFVRQIEQLAASEVQDAARSAAQAESFAQGQTHYVRILVPPSCKRCAVLAGRLYRTDAAFNRHPGCDCTSEPAASMQDALDRGLAVSPDEAYRRGWIRDLTDGERSAINDGADIGKVINSSSGIGTATFGRQSVKTTTYGTTRRSSWRKSNPSRPVRLRPESIYRIADGNRDEALRLLRLYGYL